MCEVGALTRQCGAATPGIAKIYAIDVADVTSVPAASTTTWTITGPLTLASGKFFKDLPFVEQKAGLIDDIADAVGGGFQKQIPLKLAKYGAETNMWINNLIGARFIVIIADNNGQMIMVGSLTAPMRLEKAKGATGTKFGEENGWDLQLTAEGTAPCYAYTGAVPLS